MTDKEIGTYKLMIEVQDKAIQALQLENKILMDFTKAQDKYIDFLKTELETCKELLKEI